MNNLLREYINYKIRNILEDREYKLRQLSPKAFEALGNEVLNVPESAIQDVKILKATRPIFKVFLDNGQTFNLIDNGSSIQADIERVLYDLKDQRDLNGAKTMIDLLLQKPQIASEPDETAGEDFEDMLADETPAEEPAPEEEA